MLIGKALIEIPPKFAGQPPVNPKSSAEAANGPLRAWKGAQGLAEDVRFYGKWMRDEAEKRIGHLYPNATLPDGSQATVIAWLWARTVRSPDPAAKGAMVPLASNFVLSTRVGKKAWVEPLIDPCAPDGWRFDVSAGALSASDEERLKNGTKAGKGKAFTCLLTGSAIDFAYIRREANGFGLSSRLMAIVAEGNRSRVYLAPTIEHEAIAADAKPDWGPEELVTTPSHDVDRLPMYGMKRWRDAFTARQLLALTTFSDLVSQARDKVMTDARAAPLSNEPRRLHEGGLGSAAYADAVATYLGLSVSRVVNRGATLTFWDNGGQKI